MSRARRRASAGQSQDPEGRSIQPKSDTTEKLRFNWNTPVAVSPNEVGTIYIGAQYLFRRP